MTDIEQKENERTYKSFKDFFDKVKQSNERKLYSYSYVLLFSFFEDRIKRIFETQCEVYNGVKPNQHEYRDSIHKKLRSIKSWGIDIKEQQFTGIDTITQRRNIIVHDAMFHTNSVTLKDVTTLEKIGRYFDSIRTQQKKDNPKLFPKKSVKSMKDGLRLKFFSNLPRLQNMRSFDPSNPQQKNRFDDLIKHKGKEQPSPLLLP